MLDIAEDKGKALAAKLNETYPGKVEFMNCDVSKEDSVTAAFNAVVSKVKQLDIIILQRWYYERLRKHLENCLRCQLGKYFVSNRFLTS